MAELKEAVIVDMVRTPFCRSGKEKGVFREYRSDDMGVTVLQEIVKRTVAFHLKQYSNQDKHPVDLEKECRRIAHNAASNYLYPVDGQ